MRIPVYYHHREGDRPELVGFYTATGQPNPRARAYTVSVFDGFVGERVSEFDDPDARYVQVVAFIISVPGTKAHRKGQVALGVDAVAYDIFFDHHDFEPI